jgi:CHASE2 domain-containing sensor protein
MTVHELTPLQRDLLAGERRSRAYLALRVLVRAIALMTMLGFAFAFAWFVVPVVPISVFMVVGFGAGAGLLFVATRHSRYRRSHLP